MLFMRAHKSFDEGLRMIRRLESVKGEDYVLSGQSECPIFFLLKRILSVLEFHANNIRVQQLTKGRKQTNFAGYYFNICELILSENLWR